MTLRWTSRPAVLPLLVWIMSSFSLAFLSTRRSCVCAGFSFHTRDKILSNNKVEQQQQQVRLYAGSRPRLRQRSNKIEPLPSLQEQKGELSWETFEFGSAPKWDARFDTTHPGMIVASNEEELQEIRETEAIKDLETARRINQQTQAWQRLDPALVQRAMQVLRPYVRDDRVQRMTSVLRQRTKHARLLFENPVNPSNVWACLRTIDSFGLQYVDLIIESGRYLGKGALSQKRGMRTAMGSAHWLTLRHHASTTEAVALLKEQEGHVILASDLNPNSIDIRDIQWNDFGDKPLCLVMGNEENGISQEMRDLADVTFTLPMSGFAESFNLSVATAITLAHLSAASCSNDQRNSKQAAAAGPLRPGDLTEEEFNALLLKGFLNSVPQRRMSLALLKQAGIELPEEVRKL